MSAASNPGPAAGASSGLAATIARINEIRTELARASAPAAAPGAFAAQLDAASAAPPTTIGTPASAKGLPAPTATAAGPGAHATPGGYVAPLPPGAQVIGHPYQGTHTLGNWQSDNAVDWRVPEGTPIFAVADGVIGPKVGPLDSTSPRFAGERLTLEAPGNAFYYAHLSDIVVVPGQPVVRGQLLGYSGSANGVPHLHFGMREGDPAQAFLSS